MPPFQRAQKITERLNINIACGFQLSEPCNELFGGIDSKCPVRTKCREHAEVLLRSGNILMMLKVITRIINRTKRPHIELSENPAPCQIRRLQQSICAIPNCMGARLIQEHSNVEIPF